MVSACFFAIGSNAQPDQTKDWQPPKNGVIRDSKTAISIAHAIYASMNPDLKISNEKDWQSHFTATLNNGTWEVGEKTEPGSLGGGLWILLSQRDAHVVSIYLIQ